MNAKIEIKDIYIGKPDAKDELISDEYDKFLKGFVTPTNNAEGKDYKQILSEMFS